MQLPEKEMYEINGGVSWGIMVGIITSIVYFVGCLSGYTNPTRCNN